jgi:tetratricopeptide (TPR) repeat protein
MAARTMLGLSRGLRLVDRARRAPAPLRAAVLSAASYEAHIAGDMPLSNALGIEAFDDGVVAGCPAPYRVYWTLVSGSTYGTPSADALPIVEGAPAVLERFGAPIAEQARLMTLVTQAATNAGRLDIARPNAERAYQLARESRNPSTLMQVLYHLGALYANDDADAAIAAFTECLSLARRGTMDSSVPAAHYQRSLLRARAGDRRRALTDLREGIVRAAELGHSPQLMGAFGYSIEILTVLGEYEMAAVVIGAARSGALSMLRAMASPPDRKQRGSAPVRAALDEQRFEALNRQGAVLSLDELQAWLLASLDDLIG